MKKTVEKLLKEAIVTQGICEILECAITDRVFHSDLQRSVFKADFDLFATLSEHYDTNEFGQLTTNLVSTMLYELFPETEDEGFKEMYEFINECQEQMFKEAQEQVLELFSIKFN